MRYKLTLEYDGTGILGWQRQLDGPSAQENLETAIARFLGRTPLSREEYAAYKESRKTDSSYHTDTFVAGRTDAGVHALAQVVHFDLDNEIDSFRMLQGLNHHLRSNEIAMSILKVEKVADDFHARFSAVGRGYIYKILNRRAFPALQKNRVWWVPAPLDVEKMQEAAKYLLGNHDFTSFRAAACQAKSPIRTLDKLDVIRSGEEIDFIVEARSFLHHQVRNMVGTLKMVGSGQLEPQEMLKILEAKDRRCSGPNAPACGLYLNKVVY